MASRQLNMNKVLELSYIRILDDNFGHSNGSLTKEGGEDV